MTRKPSSDKSPAGAPPEQRALDRPWRVRAAAAVVTAVTIGALLGFVVIPAAQRSGGQLTMGHAMQRAAGMEPGSPAVPQPLSGATSIPVSTVSWDPAVMKILAAGRTDRGAAIAARTCAVCHGDKGLSQGGFPSLAGQTPQAIYKQLHDFRSGARVHPQMTPYAKALAPADLANVAAYYASASKEYAAIGARDLLGDSEIEKLAHEGDSRRRIPACLSCHVNGSGGPIETPVIAGKHRSISSSSSRIMRRARARTMSMAACATSHASSLRRNESRSRVIFRGRCNAQSGAFSIRSSPISSTFTEIRVRAFL